MALKVVHARDGRDGGVQPMGGEATTPWASTHMKIEMEIRRGTPGGGSPFPRSISLALKSFYHSSVCVPCVIAPPARSAAATNIVSASSCSVAPAFFAFFE